MYATQIKTQGLHFFILFKVCRLKGSELPGDIAIKKPLKSYPEFQPFSQ